MPKYYVSCMDKATIVSGENELDACVKASEKMQITTVGISWFLSERGFATHDDDIMIPSYIIDEYTKRNNKSFDP